MSLDAGAVVRAVLDAGADQAQVRYVDATKQELNAEWGEVSLLRTTFDRQLEVVALSDGRRGTLTINDTRDTAVSDAVQQVLELARGSKPDPANALVDGGAARSFESGPAEADIDAMCQRLEDFLAYAPKRWPASSLRGVHLDFTRATTTLRSSTGIDLASSTGAYQAVAVFSSRDGADVSSFNYSAWQGRSLDKPLHELGSFSRLLTQSEGQLHPERVSDKFVGDVVITPDCLPSFLRPLCALLSDDTLIAGTSVYKDALGTEIADGKLTLHSRPADDRRARPAFFTRDGRVSEDATIVDAGTLNTFLLTERGARRTGLPCGPSDGGGFEIDPGDTALADLIASIDRGVLLARFSGGRPSDNGDFSGVAKNSYLIENGEVRTPLAETMVSGNLVKMLKQVRGISSDHIDFGHGDLPWVAFRGLTIS